MIARRSLLIVTILTCLQAASDLAASQQKRDLVLIKPARRLALVVGNDTYPQAPLQNARNDARAMADTLRNMSFEVTLVEDATREALVSAVARFGAGLRSNDLAWIFFAGHGLQVSGENFLIPADFKGTTETEVRLSALPVSELQNAVRNAQVSIIVLDACRNNPFLGTRSGGGGLAPLEARGNLIAFATGAGQTASDNDAAKNGLFTQELLREIRRPGISIRDVFFRVRQSVFDASSGRQFPAVYDGLLGDLMLGELSINATPALPPDPGLRRAGNDPVSAARKGGNGKLIGILAGAGGAAALGAVAAGGGGSGPSSGPASSSPSTRRLTLAIQGTGGGSVSSSPAGISCGSGTCTADFTIGSNVTLTATADNTSTFSTWNGECATSATTCSLSMTADRSAGAVFDRVTPVNVQIPTNVVTFDVVQGVTIRVGSRVTFAASGLACHDSPGCSTRDTPAGSGLGTAGPNAKLPGAPLHSLICGIGGQSAVDLFYVGTSLTITSTKAGSLFCGMNEGQADQSQYNDNTGTWSLVITVSG